MIDTYSNMVTRVGRNVGIVNDSAYDPKIKDWMNEAYEDAHRFFIWPDTLFRDTVPTVIDQDFVTMPQQCAQILFLSQQSSPVWMEFENAANFVRRFYKSLQSTDTGTPKYWTPDGRVPILKQPTSASVVTIVSSSGSDLSQTVRVWGRNANGVLVTDTIQLNGTSTVAGTVSFTSIEKISKSSNTTAGIVTCTSNAAAVTLCRIAQREYVQSVIRIRLQLIPDAVINMFLVGKKHMIPLVFDEDVPAFDCVEAIIAATTARALREQGDYVNAETYAGGALAILTRMRDEILGQADGNFKILPYVPRRSQIRGYS
jgi:hypothetical protein